MNEPTDTDRLARLVADTMLASEGTGPAWGLTIDEVREGYAKVRMAIRPDMANGHGIAHGGMIFALADSAFAYACNSRNAVTVASSATIHFLSPGKVGETLIAEASEVAAAGRSGSYSVVVRCVEDGRTIAAFSGLSRQIGGAIVDVAGSGS